MKTTLRLLFELKGDFNPSVVTNRVQIEPFKSLRKGEPGRYGGILKYDYWCLDTGEVNTLDLDEISASIYDKLELKGDQIANIVKEYDLTAVFTIVARIDHDNVPGIHFSEDIVSLGSKIGASFDVDLYVNT